MPKTYCVAATIFDEPFGKPLRQEFVIVGRENVEHVYTTWKKTIGHTANVYVFESSDDPFIRSLQRCHD